MSEEDKNKVREYGKNRFHNMSDEKKQNLKEYQKRKYQEAKKSKHVNKILLTKLFIIIIFSLVIGKLKNWILMHSKTKKKLGA